ncbi:HNH endonuclease [Lactiplantibacillus plantarum]|uniref:HNH endonuclease n=1 Tax=Lactiplantibacillus plantarum TaxID=1590 RepID=UPI000E671DE2|nr:HNH endonuclease signature motif containing protein [Lactiplantibacillus plantarum]
MIKKYCAFGGCKRLVNLNERYCDKHKPKDSHTSKTSDYANEIHASNRWRKTSRLYREANPICEQCLKASKEGDQSRGKRAGMINLATSVDHIVPLFAGGSAYDWNNLQSLCDYHHLKITTRTGAKKISLVGYINPEQYRGL